MNETMPIQEVADQFDGVIDPFLDLLLPNASPVLSLAHALIKVPSGLKDYWLCKKFEKFYKAIYNSDLTDSVKYSSQLFGDVSTAHENAFRLIQYIDKAESLKTIDYIINASRAVGNQMINSSDYFRIIRAIVHSFPDDLSYFQTIATSTESQLGDIRIMSLAQSGLMISSTIMVGRSIEEQGYSITRLGFLVDRYALSFDDEKRQNIWKQREADVEDQELRADIVTPVKNNDNDDYTLKFN